MKINTTIIQNLKHYNLSIEEFYLLWSKQNQEEWEKIVSPSNEAYKSLRERKYLDTNNNVTTTGYYTLSRIVANELIPASELEFDDEWKLFWKTFPSHDGFGNYEKTRNLRSNKQQCKTLFKKYLQEGISHLTIIDGLKREIELKKQQSKKESNLQYMKNSYRWLKEKEWETYSGYKLPPSNNKADVI